MSIIQKNLPVFLIILLLASCSNPNDPITAPTDSENEVITAKGDAIAIGLVKTLKGAVKQAIDSNGVVAAITVCNVEAIPLTQEVASLAGEDVNIKRTSFKTRNPVNAPDQIETAALNHFEELLIKGEALPPHYTQKVVMEGDTSYYYYKPMKVESLCLLCHGSEETMMPEVRENLAKLYPDDQATGYREGDFRGLIRVKLKSL